MELHEKRVLTEEADLSGKLGRLQDFLATTVFLDLDSDGEVYLTW